jgi:serine/threonine protein kinase
MIDCSYVCRFYACGRTSSTVSNSSNTTDVPITQGSSETITVEYNFLVMQLLGSNLSDIRKKQPGGKFSLATSALLSKQMLIAIEALHDQGYLHRDVKPVSFLLLPCMLQRSFDRLTVQQSNFAMGLEKVDEYGRQRCYIIDFGLARRFMTPEGTVREVGL